MGNQLGKLCRLKIAARTNPSIDNRQPVAGAQNALRRLVRLDNPAALIGENHSRDGMLKAAARDW
jgi:hypothetical protein